MGHTVLRAGLVALAVWGVGVPGPSSAAVGAGVPIVAPRAHGHVSAHRARPGSNPSPQVERGPPVGVGASAPSADGPNPPCCKK